MLTFALITQSLKEYANFVKDYKYNKDDLWKIIGGISITIFLIIYYFFFTGIKESQNIVATQNQQKNQPNQNVLKKDDFNVTINKCYEYPLNSQKEESDNIIIKIEKRKK